MHNLGEYVCPWRCVPKTSKQRDKFDRNYAGTSEHDQVAATNVLQGRPAPPPFDDPNIHKGSDAFHHSWDDTPADLGDTAPQTLVDATKTVPADTDRIENWAAIWATDTIAESKKAMANVTYKKTRPRKWTIMFSD